MDDKGSYWPTGRDIAGGWLLCAVVAALALGVASALHGGMAPVAASAATIRSVASASGVVSAGPAQTPKLRELVGLRHAFEPMPHPDYRPHG